MTINTEVHCLVTQRSPSQAENNSRIRLSLSNQYPKEQKISLSCDWAHHASWDVPREENQKTEIRWKMWESLNPLYENRPKPRVQKNPWKSSRNENTQTMLKLPSEPSVFTELWGCDSLHNRPRPPLPHQHHHHTRPWRPTVAPANIHCINNKLS